jgi:capsule polysaccharide export protein KpsE/RkpR
MDELVNKTRSNAVEFRGLDSITVLAKHSRMIIYISAVVTILAYLNLYFSPNIYRAHARLMPPQQNMTLSAQLLENLGGGGISGDSGGGGLGGMAASLLGMRSPNEFYVAIMTGDTISNRMIDRFDLKNLYKAKYYETARNTLKSNCNIIGSRKDGMIIINVTDRDPNRAAAIANAFGEEVDKLLQELSVQEAKNRLVFLDKERVLATENLSKAEEALRSFSEQKGVIQIDAQTKVMLEYIASLRAMIDAKEVQIRVLRQQATPLNYDMIRLETERESLKERLQAAETKWDQNCINDVCLPASQTPNLGLEYIRLYREAKFQEGLYKLFVKMAELARIDIVKNVSLVKVADKATIPERRSNTRLSPALMAGAIAFLIMIFLAFGYDYYLRIREKEPYRLSVIINFFTYDWNQIKIIFNKIRWR